MMAGKATNLFEWPALAGADLEPLQGATFEHAVWGKVHGAASDARWIAASASFTGQDLDLEHELELGSEDAPRSTQLWRTLDGSHFAVGCYPSRAVDAAGRQSQLEKQILEWRRPAATPAAAGSLLLMPVVTALSDEIWWPHRKDLRWSESDFVLPLDPWRPVVEGDSVTGAVAQAIDRGLGDLRRHASAEALSDLYAAVLANQRTIPLRGLESPLGPLALAVLMLPLERDQADRLSIAGWLPSSRADAGEQQARWNLVLGGESPLAAGGDPPNAEQRQRGQRLAQTLIVGDPSQLKRPMVTVSGPTATKADGDQPPTRLALWGPSAAGKTVLLAQLYFELDAEVTDWEIYPTQSSLAFIQQMRSKMRSNNAFPAPTMAREQISYTFRHRQTGAEASLVVDDRPGGEFEKLEADIQQRLAEAEGLVLLFDPLRPPARLEQEIWRTLEGVYLARGESSTKDSRPIAVCISKADVLIKSPADFRRARREMEEFVRERVNPILIKLLDRFCDHYRLFPVSAAGVDLHHGSIERVVFYDENLTPRICSGGQAFNLMAPFAWLLEELVEKK